LEDADDLVDFVLVAEGLAGRAADRESVRRVLAADVDVAEEERLVLHDRSAEAEAALLLLEAADRRLLRSVERRLDLADQALVAAEPVAGAAEGVRAAARDHVDRSA